MNNDLWIKAIKKEIKNQIAVDFDGVIHSNISKNPLYPIDEPINGVHEALKSLSRKYDIIVYTCRARSDRPNNGINLVTQWLEDHSLMQYIKEVTSIKPRASYYIDDKAIKFENWNNIRKELRL